MNIFKIKNVGKIKKNVKKRFKKRALNNKRKKRFYIYAQPCSHVVSI